MSVPKTKLGDYRRYAIFRGVLKLQGKVLLTMMRSGLFMVDHPDYDVYKALDDCTKRLKAIIE